MARSRRTARSAESLPPVPAPPRPMTVRELHQTLAQIMEEEPGMGDFIVALAHDPEGNGVGAMPANPEDPSAQPRGFSIEHYTQHGWRSGSTDDPGEPNALVLWPMV